MSEPMPGIDNVKLEKTNTGIALLVDDDITVELAPSVAYTLGCMLKRWVEEWYPQDGGDE